MLRHVRGSTLLEVVVGAALIAFALVAALESIESVGQLSEVQRQQRRALEVAETKLAYLRAQPFSSVLATIAACSTLRTFTVPDLPRPRSTAAQGQITTYATDETAVPAEVGGPLDLNGNGTATDTTVSGTLQLLPLKVTVSWGSAGSNKKDLTLTLWTVLNAGDSP